MMKPAGVLCCGSIVLDIVVRPVDRFVFNSSVWVDAIEQQLGGNGASTSYALALLGVPVRLLGAVGSDPFGEFALARLRSAGCDVSNVRVLDDRTATTVSVVNSAGERLLLHRPGVSVCAFAEPIEFSPRLTAGLSHFHFANFYSLPRLRTRAAETVRAARAAGLTVSVDTGWDSQGRWLEDLGPCLPMTDLLFANEKEARILTGIEDPRAAGLRLCELGAGTVVVKLGGEGCLVLREGIQISASAYDVPVLDTTGAGDCFAGGFLAALGRGASLQEAAQFANAVAALSIQTLGATAGLRSYEETAAWMSAAKLAATT
ncbi:MAG TPA: carbohydrate kinase family protein [Bryobacteraceae bacterium]|nr:carbohydrate kinase family protein [Bryobacteraceae bacterium]HOQ46435.1 carbohydrate kinase family protein [Bryobacteraceae bacterium]HPQ15351.1 carbohydrate kinase family protein [Bryobacteraceae bacterium]HPU72596.1 carbohydrate kinase family protein [Bryobacteraceae bacterium]